MGYQGYSGQPVNPSDVLSHVLHRPGTGAPGGILQAGGREPRGRFRCTSQAGGGSRAIAKATICLELRNGFAIEPRGHAVYLPYSSPILCSADARLLAPIPRSTIMR